MNQHTHTNKVCIPTLWAMAFYAPTSRDGIGEAVSGTLPSQVANLCSYAWMTQKLAKAESVYRRSQTSTPWPRNRPLSLRKVLMQPSHFSHAPINTH